MNDKLVPLNSQISRIIQPELELELKDEDRKTITPNQNIVLINQVDSICPLCGKKLMYDKKNQKRKDYEVAHIYPLSPSPKEQLLLKDEDRLSENVNDLDNLIPLCPSCHTQFDKPRTVEEYRKLSAIKKKLINKDLDRQKWYDFKIENEIMQIVSSLNSASEKINCKISYDVKDVNNKMQLLSPLVSRRIRTNITQYFPFVKEQFALLEENSPSSSEMISMQIKTYFLSLKKDQRTDEDIYPSVVEWIYAKTQKTSKEAAEIIVAFFIQNCEVF